ncbi:MAG: hypothetical protein M1830_007657 [Pleopsidium flavum]|nr:MAG: hypothetical protein M1830_007657 [Pleopsidium flavum]
MHSNLNTNAKPFPTAPLDFSHHLGDRLALVHQLRAQTVSAGPALRTPTVDVDAIAIGLDESGGTRELKGGAGRKLGD